jgi:hypothetical protein
MTKFIAAITLALLSATSSAAMFTDNAPLMRPARWAEYGDVPSDYQFKMTRYLANIVPNHANTVWDFPTLPQRAYSNGPHGNVSWKGFLVEVNADGVKYGCWFQYSGLMGCMAYSNIRQWFPIIPVHDGKNNISFSDVEYLVDTNPGQEAPGY